MAEITSLTFEESLFAELTTNTNISSIVGTSIFPVLAKDGFIEPHIVYSEYAQNFIHSLGADSGYNEKYIQFTLYHQSYSGVKSISKALRKALINFSGKMGGESGIDVQSVICESGDISGFEGMGLYSIIQEYKFIYIEEV